MVAIWRVDLPFLREEDWKYEGSKAAEDAATVPTLSE